MEGNEGLPNKALDFIRSKIDKIIPKQLKGADLNPHEGKLRGSQIPRRYMNIPDHPPVEPQSGEEPQK